MDAWHKKTKVSSFRNSFFYLIVQLIDTPVDEPLDRYNQERLLAQCLVDHVFKEVFQSSAYSTTSYLAPGKKSRFLLSNQHQIYLEVQDGPSEPKKIVREKAVKSSSKSSKTSTVKKSSSKSIKNTNVSGDDDLFETENPPSSQRKLAAMFSKSATAKQEPDSSAVKTKLTFDGFDSESDILGDNGNAHRKFAAKEHSEVAEDAKEDAEDAGILQVVDTHIAHQQQHLRKCLEAMLAREKVILQRMCMTICFHKYCG